jgi:hypothetical protein
MDERDRLSYDPADGSGSYADKRKDFETPDSERAVSDVGATTFNPSDVSGSNSGRYEQLKKRHHGHFAYSGKDSITEDLSYDARTVCNRLETTDVQQERVFRLIDEIRKPRRRYESVIMAAVSYVLNEDGRWIQRDDSEFGDPLSSVYYEILDSYDVEEQTVRKLRRELSDADSESEDSDDDALTFSLSDGPSEDQQTADTYSYEPSDDDGESDDTDGKITFTMSDGPPSSANA